MKELKIDDVEALELKLSKSIEESLKTKYFLISKTLLIAILATAGASTIAGAWGAAQAAINKRVKDGTLERIKAMERQAITSCDNLKKIVDDAGTDAEIRIRLNKFAKMLTLTSLNKGKTAISLDAASLSIRNGNDERALRLNVYGAYPRLDWLTKHHNKLLPGSVVFRRHATLNTPERGKWLTEHMDFDNLEIFRNQMQFSKTP